MHVSELFSLKGKCAVVVGGAGKIGFPISEALAEAGAHVCITSWPEKHFTSAVEKITHRGLKADGFLMDQSDEKSVASFLHEVKFKTGIPDILVNCGVERPMKQYFNDSPENWDRSMAVNARGLFVTCRAFIREMKEHGGGSVINISSIYGSIASDPFLYEGTDMHQTEPDYPYTKGGMNMFSKYLASYFAKDNIRVNCIAPGGFFNNQPEPFLSRYIAKVPLGRMLYHDDLKGIAVFLASDASRYITGVIIPVDGGITIR